MRLILIVPTNEKDEHNARCKAEWDSRGGDRLFTRGLSSVVGGPVSHYIASWSHLNRAQVARIQARLPDDSRSWVVPEDASLQGLLRRLGLVFADGGLMI